MDGDEAFDTNGFALVDVDPHAYEEEQLAAAIAASLAEASAPTATTRSSATVLETSVIEIDSSDSESDFGAAPGSRLFLDDDSPDRPRRATASSSSTTLLIAAEPKQDGKTVAAESSMSAFMRERAEMERARLDRQKRRRDEFESQEETPGAGSSSSSVAPLSTRFGSMDQLDDSDIIQRAVKLV